VREVQFLRGHPPEAMDILVRTTPLTVGGEPFTIVALMQIEDMGFCKKGEGGAFVEGERLYFKNSRI